MEAETLKERNAMLLESVQNLSRLVQEILKENAQLKAEKKANDLRNEDARIKYNQES